VHTYYMVKIGNVYSVRRTIDDRELFASGSRESAEFQLAIYLTKGESGVG
jgi:hypothetical protein